MEEVKGIKESTELLKAVLELPVDLGVELKDGFQWDDVVHLGQKLATKPVYVEGVKGLREVLPELKDVQVEEVLSLVMVLVTKVPQLLAAYKKGELQKVLA